MTDRYEKIRRALAMGPTPGPWYGIQCGGSRWTDIYQSGNRCATPIVYVPPCNVLDEHGTWKESEDETMANAKHVAACDPDTIRALLEERDAQQAEIERLRKDAERYRWLRDGASEQIEESDPWDSVGHIQPPLVCLKPGLQVYLAGHDLDAAIDAAMEKENKA